MHKSKYIYNIKGLWIYKETIKISDEHHILIIDSEGLGSVDVSKN